MDDPFLAAPCYIGSLTIRDICVSKSLKKNKLSTGLMLPPSLVTLHRPCSPLRILHTLRCPEYTFRAKRRYHPSSPILSLWAGDSIRHPSGAFSCKNTPVPCKFMLLDGNPKLPLQNIRDPTSYFLCLHHALALVWLLYFLPFRQGQTWG